MSVIAGEDVRSFGVHVLIGKPGTWGGVCPTYVTKMRAVLPNLHHQDEGCPVEKKCFVFYQGWPKASNGRIRLPEGGRHSTDWGWRFPDGCLTCGATDARLAYNAGTNECCPTAVIGALASQMDGQWLCLGGNNYEALHSSRRPRHLAGHFGGCGLPRRLSKHASPYFWAYALVVPSRRPLRVPIGH